jgi:hypothetical protein
MAKIELFVILEVLVWHTWTKKIIQKLKKMSMFATIFTIYMFLGLLWLILHFLYELIAK